jgi:general stress protein 26
MAKKGAKKADGKEPAIEREVRKLRKLIKSVRIAMFTTVAADGKLRSRPMANLKGGFDGDLWFVTRSTAPKTDEIRENQHVNVAFADPDDGRFVSISGLASLVRDPAKVDELWSRRLKVWFPDGKKDPDLALIRVRIDRAEVWDSKTSTMVHLEGLGAVLAAQRRGGRADDRPANTPATTGTGSAGAEG